MFSATFIRLETVCSTCSQSHPESDRIDEIFSIAPSRTADSRRFRLSFQITFETVRKRCRTSSEVIIRYYPPWLHCVTENTCLRKLIDSALNSCAESPAFPCTVKAHDLNLSAEPHFRSVLPLWRSGHRSESRTVNQNCNPVGL